MHILVVGNQGYIGTVMVEELLTKGYEVTGYDARFFEPGDLSKDPNQKKIKQIKKDIRSVISEDLKSVDAIFFLAAIPNDPNQDLDPRLTEEINHKATINFAKLAKEKEIKRFVFASSCSVYGAAGDNIITEDSPLNPISIYAKYKRETEKELSNLADINFCPVFMRLGTAFGLSPRMRFDLIVNDLTGRAYKTGKIKLLDGGSAWRPNVHVKDISHAFIATLKEDTSLIRNEILNVGRDSETMRTKEIAETVANTVPNSVIEYADEKNVDPRTYRVGFEKISRILKTFKPQWTVKKGVEEIHDALKSSELPSKDLESENFHNIKRLKNLLQTQLDKDLFWK